MNTQLEVLRSCSVPFQQHFPAPGLVEHRGEEIWASVLEGIRQVTKDLNPKHIECIGITNQRETVVFWDQLTGAALGPAIVWQDRRTARECEALPEEWFRERTGLLMDPYFSGTKISWAIQHSPPVREAYKAGRLRFGTVDSFLLHRMSAGKVYQTEPSNASRTLAFNIHTLQQDPELSLALGIKDVGWPEVRPSMGHFGETLGLENAPLAPGPSC
jgi:glycerol kinase